MSARTTACCVVVFLAPTGVLADPGGSAGPPGDETQAPTPLNVFEGRVVEYAEHKPVAGAKIVVADAERGFLAYHGPENVFAFAPDDKVLFFFTKRNGKRSGEGTTDSEGRFVIKGLAAGKYNLLAVHPELGVTIMDGVEQPNAGDALEVTLDPPTFLQGTILGLGADGMFLQTTLVPSDPWGAVQVQAVVSIGPDGQSRAGPLPILKADSPIPRAEQWAFQAETVVLTRGFFAPLLTVPVEIEPGKVNELEIDVAKGLQVTGEVRGPEGEPLKDVSVVLRTTGEPAYAYGGLTDDKGKYVLTGLPPGDYTLDAKRWARRTAPG